VVVRGGGVEQVHYQFVADGMEDIIFGHCY
jgi:hypothetical protein